MAAKAFVFAVWAPVGDDCPPALAAVAADSLRAALTAVRGAGLRLVERDPLGVEPDLTELDRWRCGAVVWRFSDEREWRPV